MKTTDRYDVKLEIWAKESRVYRLPVAAGIPRFGSKKFKSYEEFNAWKKELLNQIAAKGGVKWTK